MANKEELNKKAEETVTMEEEMEEELEMENVEKTEQTAEDNVVHLPVKKGGFWSDLGIGAKIGVGLVFTGIGVGLGFLVKSLLGAGKDDGNSNDAIPAEGTVTETAE